MSTLYVIAAVLIVLAVVLLVLLGATAAMVLVLGAGTVLGWLGPRAYRLARRALEVAGHAVRDVREPSGRHRRIGSAPRGPEVPPKPDHPPLIWLDPDATHELPQVKETAA